MIENLEELKDQLEVKFTSKFTTDYKVSETTDLRVTIRTNTIKYYLIINDMPIPNEVPEEKVLETIKTLVLTELMELQRKYKEDKSDLDRVNILFNGVTLN